MDINSVLHLISSQIEKIIGVVAALFIATTALLIFRSIKEERKSESGGVSGGTDTTSIEEALKRVLAQTPVTARIETGPAPAAPSSAQAAGGPDDRDDRISALQSALQKAQTLLQERMESAVTPSAPGVAIMDDAALTDLKREVDELRARLSEYEIIEDDIADLAMFKEENARLKQEVESLKTSTPVAAAPALAPTPNAPAKAPAPQPAAPDKTPEPVPPVQDPFQALMDEAKRRSEATPVEPETAPAVAQPAAESTVAKGGVHDPADTERMAQEAQALADATSKNAPTEDEGVEVLNNLVDTDKLIDEVNALDAEDLMSEFKDKGKP